MTARFPNEGHDDAGMAAALRRCSRCHGAGSDLAPLGIEGARFVHVARCPAPPDSTGTRTRKPLPATHGPSTATRPGVAERAADHDAECSL